MTSHRTSADLEHAAALLEERAGGLLAEACRQAGVELVSHRSRSIHHRSGRSVSHVFEARVATTAEARDVLLVAHVDRKAYPDTALVLERGGDRVAVWRFPHDPYLPGLPSAIDRTRVRELLDRLGAPAGEVTLRTRAYRPSRRAVVEVSVGTTPRPQRLVYFKILSGDRAARLADRHRQLAGLLPVPSVVGVAARQGLVALEALPGRTLRDVLASDAPAPAPEQLLEISQRLAASGLASSTSPRAFADPTRHVQMLTRLAPDLAATVERVAEATVRIDGPETVVHGDFHAGQLLIEDAEVTGLLDIDGAGTGLLAHDAGTLVAYLQVLGELHTQMADRMEAYAARVADAYRPVVGARALARATAGAWLALSTAAHRSQEPDWQQTTRARIHRAAAELDA